VVLRERRRLLFEDRGRHVRVCRALECTTTGEHFVEHAANRKEIDAMIDRVAPQLLRCHVTHRPEHNANLGDLARVGAD